MKYDVKTAYKALYAPKNVSFELLEVPPQRFVSIQGIGSPQSSEFSAAIETLYSVSFPLKFISKARSGFDYVVGPLEALWWADDYTAFVSNHRNSWRWRLISAVPDSVSDEDLDAAQHKSLAKGAQNATQTSFHTLDEGLCFQALYLGPFSDEGPVLEHLHNTLMPSEELTFNGHHHEIYLSDMLKTEPSKLRTVLRQPGIKK